MFYHYLINNYKRISYAVGSHEGGIDPNHRPEDEPQPADSLDITASGLYWQRTERRFEPAGRWRNGPCMPSLPVVPTITVTRTAHLTPY